MDNPSENQPRSSSNENSEILLLRMDGPSNNQPTSSFTESSENPSPRMDNPNNNRLASSTDECSENHLPRMDNLSNNQTTSSSNEFSENHLPRMENLSNNQSTSSSNKSSKEFDGSLEECKNKETLQKETNRNMNGLNARMVLDVLQEVKYVHSLISRLTLTEHLYKMLKIIKQNLPNTVKNDGLPYLTKACEEGHLISDSRSMDSVDRLIAFDISPSINCRTFSYFIDYLSADGQSPNIFWKVDTERLKACLDTFNIQRKKKREALLEISNRTQQVIEDINVLIHSIEYIEKDRCVIYSRRREEAVLVNKTLKSLNRLLWTYFKILTTNMERLVAHVESLCTLKEETVQHMSEFLNSDLDIYLEVCTLKPIN